MVSGVWHFQRKTRDRNMQSMVLHLAVTNAVRGQHPAAIAGAPCLEMGGKRSLLDVCMEERFGEIET